MTWRPMHTAPTDGTPVILAIPVSHGDGWAIGEARYVEDMGGELSGWWWAGIEPGEYFGDRLDEANYAESCWQPMPESPPARLPVRD